MFPLHIIVRYLKQKLFSQTFFGTHCLFGKKYIFIPNIPIVCPTFDFLYLIMVLGKLNELARIGVCVLYFFALKAMIYLQLAILQTHILPYFHLFRYKQQTNKEQVYIGGWVFFIWRYHWTILNDMTPLYTN